MTVEETVFREVYDLMDSIRQSFESTDEVLHRAKLLRENESLLSHTQLRNVLIRLLYQHLRKNGMKSGKTLEFLSNMSHHGVYLCKETIRNIVY